MRIGYVRFLIVCLMAVALPACAGSATPQPSGGSIPPTVAPTVTSLPASLVITDADHGKTYELHLWESAELT